MPIININMEPSREPKTVIRLTYRNEKKNLSIFLPYLDCFIIDSIKNLQEIVFYNSIILIEGKKLYLIILINFGLKIRKAV